MQSKLTAAAVLVLASLATGCGFFGVSPKGPATAVLAVLHHAPQQWLLDGAQEVIQDAANDGGHVSVYLVTSGSTASMRKIALPQDGDSRSTSKNARDWPSDAANFTEAATAAVRSALESEHESAPGAAVAGAIAEAVELVETTRRAADRKSGHIVVLTSGLEETADVSLVGIPEDEAAALGAQAAKDALRALDAPAGGDGLPVDIELRGVGDFSHSDQPVAQEVPANARAYWDAYCSGLADAVRSCTAHREMS